MTMIVLLVSCANAMPPLVACVSTYPMHQLVLHAASTVNASRAFAQPGLDQDTSRIAQARVVFAGLGGWKPVSGHSTASLPILILASIVVLGA